MQKDNQSYLPGMEITDIQQLTSAGETLSQLHKEKEEIEKSLSAINKKIDQLESVILPNLFDSCGLEEIKLQNGTKIQLNEFYVGKITDDKREAALNWLRQNNHDGIIKDTLTARFERGQDQVSQRLMEDLMNLGINFDKKEDIHHSTLKSFINEQIEQPDFPKELFNVFQVRKVKFQ